MGIPIYAIYGSHDYSPNETSMIDVLNNAGLLNKIVEGEVVGKRLRLKFFSDPRTGAKLTGLSARKVGLERDYFEMLEREKLEREPGFKIFAFHSAISELKPEYLAHMESIPASLLPRGFDYYAGGHVHQGCEASLPDYRRVVYPGALFAGYPRDLEYSARGVRRGFFIVNFDDGVEDVKFVEVPVCDYTYFECDVSGKNSVQAKKYVLESLAGMDVEEKLVVVRIRGELSGGKTSDINSNEIKALLMKGGALYVSINRYALTSREQTAVKV
ncbi:MAG: exonuclease SbcCD subunit D, partial [Candidatus Bathyarchaeia archaeon]